MTSTRTGSSVLGPMTYKGTLSLLWPTMLCRCRGLISSKIAGLRFRKVLPVSQVQLPSPRRSSRREASSSLFRMTYLQERVQWQCISRILSSQDCVEGRRGKEAAVAFVAWPWYKLRPRQYFPEQRYCTAPSTPSRWPSSNTRSTGDRAASIQTREASLEERWQSRSPRRAKDSPCAWLQRYLPTLLATLVVAECGRSPTLFVSVAINIPFEHVLLAAASQPAYHVCYRSITALLLRQPVTRLRGSRLPCSLP